MSVDTLSIGPTWATEEGHGAGGHPRCRSGSPPLAVRSPGASSGVRGGEVGEPPKPHS